MALPALTLLQNWKEIVGIVLIIAASMYILVLRESNASLELKLALATQSLTSCNQAVLDQNEKIERFETQNASNQKIIDNLAISVREAQERDKIRAEQLRKMATPESCEEALKFLNDAAAGLEK